MSGETQQITIAVIGAGDRGTMFAREFKRAAHMAKVVAIAEPREAYREAFAREYDLPANRMFNDWREMAAQPKFCDAVVVATSDREHIGPAVAFLEKGYHMILEKPMAVTLEDCQAIEAAQRKAGTIVAVCHSMRHHKGFSKVKELVDSGRIGRLITIDQLEQVEHIHQSHSYVRGNWGNEGRSSFMLLAKSCHDIDYITYLTGKKCLRVSSFGALTYFCKANAPAGSTDRCIDGCAVEASCPYSALKIYLNANREHWPAAICSADHSYEAHLQALKTGPYGRCVFHADNDVVDHQVVLLQYEDDVTATFTMTAFTQHGGRKVRVHGTLGEIAFDENAITLRTFADNNMEVITLGAESGGHGGGDSRVVQNWLQAVRERSDARILTTAQESLRTHTIVFAAEKARREGRTVELAEVEAMASV